MESRIPNRRKVDRPGDIIGVSAIHQEFFSSLFLGKPLMGQTWHKVNNRVLPSNSSSKYKLNNLVIWLQFIEPRLLHSWEFYLLCSHRSCSWNRTNRSFRNLYWDDWRRGLSTWKVYCCQCFAGFVRLRKVNSFDCWSVTAVGVYKLEATRHHLRGY